MAVEKGAGILDLIRTPALTRADLIVVFGFPVCFAISDKDKPLVYRSTKFSKTRCFSAPENVVFL